MTAPCSRATRSAGAGRRVIQESSNANTQPVTYTPRRDLSGLLEGATGVGGLLASSHGHRDGNLITHNYLQAITKRDRHGL
jgi:hypothetical protein